MINKIKQFISGCQDQERHSGDVAPLPPSTGTGRYDSTRTPPPVRPDIEHPLRTQSHSVPASPEPRPGAGRATGGRGVLWGLGVMAQRDNTRSSNDIISNLSRPSRSQLRDIPRRGPLTLSPKKTSSGARLGQAGGVVGCRAEEEMRMGREAGTCNGCRDQGTDREGRPRTRHFPGRPKGSEESISGVVVPSSAHRDSCRTSSGVWGLVVATPCCGHGRNLSSIRTCPGMKECQTLVL